MDSNFFKTGCVAILFFFLTCLPLEGKQKPLEIKESDNGLLLNREGEDYSLYVPREMLIGKSYRIVYKPDQRSIIPMSRSETHGEKNDLNYLLFKANALFHSENYMDALSYLFRAYIQDKENIRVLNMMGSTFYKIKDYEMATRYWMESYALNNTQTEIKKYLDEMIKKRR